MENTIQLESLSDELLVSLCNEGDTRAVEILVRRYKYMVKNLARNAYYLGIDKEDLIQEGMIGIYKAICEYDNSKNAKFKSFVYLCVDGQIKTALKTATRKKHMPLNQSVSLNEPITFEEEEVTLLDLEKYNISETPEEKMIDKENVKLINEAIEKNLSSYEVEVIRLYIQGKNYKEIAKIMDKPDKSVDNALQRIKKKLQNLKGALSNVN